jgi:hypothetical protein
VINAGNELLCWFVTSVDVRGERILVGFAAQYQLPTFVKITLVDSIVEELN